MRLTTWNDQLFLTTLRIETEGTGPTGTQHYSGTGFHFSYESEGQVYPFIVTNRHVVENKTLGSFHMLAGKKDEPLLGQGVSVTIQDFPTMWHFHPNDQIDVAVAPSNPLFQNMVQANLPEVCRREIPNQLIPDADTFQKLDSIERVSLVGYPAGLYDTTNILPIVRSGMTATPIQVDYNGLPCFLVDAAVFPGSSGSPVVIINEGSYKSGDSIVLGSRALFLGVIAKLHETDVRAPVQLKGIPDYEKDEYVTYKQPLNLGIVFKASTVIETIQAALNKLINQTKPQAT